MRILELHMAMSVVQRSARRSSVASAAYISGSKLVDERTGVTHDYSRRRGIELTGTAASKDAPEWALDPGRLFNAAEAREKHPRAQTARSMIVNLPDEFGADLRREAGMKIGHMLADRYGAVAYAIHQPDREGDERNHHGHFLITTRRFEDGQWAKNKDRILDDRVKGPEEYRALRAEIAGIVNDIAVREKLPVYVEFLSFEARGMDKEATRHMGWKATEMERRGEETELGTKNRDIQARNDRRGQLQEEKKVIDIEIAREELRLKRREPDAPEPQTQEERYAAFYKDTYARRASMLEEFERAHGQQEKELKTEAARLTGEIENVGFLTSLWRRVTGRTRQDREALENVSGRLSEIARLRDEQRADFERDRLIRLEALKKQQARELEREPAQALPVAVGENARTMMQARPQAPQSLVATEQAPSSLPGATDAEARRRAYFQKVGAQRKAERQAEEAKTPTKAFEEARKPKAPEPAREFDQAASGIEQTPATPAEPSADYAARKAAYMRRMHRRQDRDRDKGPSRDR